MGQQQFLLIVLGLIVVALMAVMGIEQYHQGTKANVRDMVNMKFVDITAKAIAWRETPRSMGGGSPEGQGGSYTGFDLQALGYEPNANGGYDLLDDGSCFTTYVRQNGDQFAMKWSPDASCTDHVFRIEISGIRIDEAAFSNDEGYADWAMN